MIKFTAERASGGMLYGFGLTEANLNRMQFNDEPIFFDFGYTGRPDLFGLFLYCSKLKTPKDIAANADEIKTYALPFFNEERGVVPGSLLFFPIARSVMRDLRNKPYWGYDTYIEIADARDMQLIFSGPDEESIRRYFAKAGFISPRTKQAYKGFGRRSDRNE